MPEINRTGKYQINKYSLLVAADLIRCNDSSNDEGLITFSNFTVAGSRDPAQLSEADAKTAFQIVASVTCQ